MRKRAARLLISLLARLGGLGLAHRRLTPRAYLGLLRALNPARDGSNIRLTFEYELMLNYRPEPGAAVLLVGQEVNQLYYPYFYLDHPVTVIDCKEKRRPYAGRAEFFCRRVQELPELVPAGHFGFAHFNGVYGWGVESAEDLRDAVAALAQALRPGATLLLGHNLCDHNPLGLENRSEEFFAPAFTELHDSRVPLRLENYQLRVLRRA